MSARTHLALTLALIGLAWVLTLWLPTGRSGEPALGGAAAPAHERGAADAQPLSGRPDEGTAERASAHWTAAPTASAPRVETPSAAAAPGAGLHVTGRVTVHPDDSPLVGAHVQVASFFGDRRERTTLGVAVTDENGRYAYALDPLQHLPPASLIQAFVHCELHEPGYAAEWSFGEVREREGNAVTVDLLTRKGFPLVRGRALDSSGEPVARARVTVRVGRGIEASTETDRAGRFFVERRTHASTCSLRVSHDSVGRAEREARLAPGSREFDFGDVVLLQRGVLAGRVVGLDGVPLAAARVFAHARSDHEQRYDSFDLLSGPDGRFRFANLDALPHRLETCYPTDRPLTATPDREGLVLGVPYPTAHVTLRDASGTVIPGVDLNIVPLSQDASGRWQSMQAGPDYEHETAYDGVHHLVFRRPGMYTLVAEIEDSWQQVWSARRRVSIEERHHEIALELELEARVQLAVTVVQPDGTPVERWSARAISPATGVSVTTLSSSEQGGEIMAGEWRFQVVPRAPSCGLPFEVLVRVPAVAPAAVELVSQSIGGRLILHGRTDTPPKQVPRATFEVLGPLPEKTLAHTSGTLSAGRDVELYRALPPGRYLVRGTSRAGPVSESEVVIVAGETTRLELEYPERAR